MNGNVEIEIRKLPIAEILPILDRVDNEFVPAFFSHLDKELFAQKLAEHATFVIARIENDLAGIGAFYLNSENRFLHITLFVALSAYRNMGIGKRMIQKLADEYAQNYDRIQLLVRKDNTNGLNFYTRNGFEIAEEQDVSLLMYKQLSK